MGMKMGWASERQKRHQHQHQHYLQFQHEHKWQQQHEQRQRHEQKRRYKPEQQVTIVQRVGGALPLVLGSRRRRITHGEYRAHDAVGDDNDQNHTDADDNHNNPNANNEGDPDDRRVNVPSSEPVASAAACPWDLVHRSGGTHKRQRAS
jgi:hypothetical protein